MSYIYKITEKVNCNEIVPFPLFQNHTNVLTLFTTDLSFNSIIFRARDCFFV